MRHLHVPESRLVRAAIAILCAGLVACGGGGGESSTPDKSVDASPPSSGSSAPSGGSVIASAPTTSGTASVSIATAVGTARALSASAQLSLGLPAMPVAAPALSFAAHRLFHVDSANGSDANDGLSATTGNGSGPWQTLARLVSAGLAAGDRVELACGGIWHETLTLPADGAAGSPIVVAQPAAGCGTLPAIDGSVAIAASAWTPYQGHIYKAPLSATPLQLFASTGNFTVAHFPNDADVAADPGSPWLALAADSAGAVLTTGADFALPAGVTLDTTARVHVRTNAYVIDESSVSAFDGKHITMSQAPTYPVSSGWGYFLTGQLWMLRAPGEWWYDANARQIYAWMPDSSAPTTALAASTLAKGIDLQGRSHVVIDGIAVHGVGLGVDARGTTDVSLRNMLVEDIADVGIDVAGSSADDIESNGVARTGGDAVTGWGGAMSPLLNDATGLTARNNVIRDSGVLMNGDEALSLPRRSLAALFIGGNATATGNAIVNSGYIGILAQAGSTVSDNFVYGACSVQDDCGAIYANGAYNGSQIVGNTVVHSRGDLFGQPVGNRATSAQGIYIDDKGSDMLIRANTVIDADFGLQLHNAARNTVQSNRLFANRNGQLWMQENTNQLDPAGDMSANIISDNEIAPISPSAGGLVLATSFASTARFGSFTGNRFYDRMASWVAIDSTASSSLGIAFPDWTGSTGHGSTQPADVQGAAVSQAGYAVYAPSGGNLVSNGTLATDSTGWSSWNASGATGQATRAACPAGACLQYVAGGSPGVLSSPGFALQQGAWYRLTVDVSTQTDNQVVPLIVRVGSGDYALVSDRPLAFGGQRAWTRHAVVFQATRTVPGTGARVDFDGIVAGQSIAIANLEIVQVLPSTIAQSSSIVVNASAVPLSASCPFAASPSSLCSQSFDLATAQPVSWPLTVPARSAVIVYVQDPALVDSDGDGIPDAFDKCPGTRAGVAVNASGCALTLQ
jgi:parallel beta-helix repeat protein